VPERAIFGSHEPTGDRAVSWARVVWFDRGEAHGSCATIINRWFFRLCSSSTTPWRHNHVYEVVCPDCGESRRVKIGDIRACGRERPEEVR